MTRLMVSMIDARVSSKIANAGFLAALMVVFIHVDMQPDCPAVVRWFVGIVEQGLCTVAVPAFFVISGYLLVRDVNGLLAFCAKYAFAVVLPIVAVVVARRLSPRLVRFAFGGR